MRYSQKEINEQDRFSKKIGCYRENKETYWVAVQSVMKGCITEDKHHLAKAAARLLNALPGRKKCRWHFFFNLPFVGPSKPFNLGIGAEPLARHQAEHVGDTDLTSQEL